MAGAAARAEEFRVLATHLDARSATWRQRIADGTADGERAARVLNDAKIHLSRTLVPVASTVVGPYGQDRYGHAWQTQMIPSLVPYPALAAMDRDSEAFQTWWVALIRARNRVADALDQATRITQHALGTLA